MIRISVILFLISMLVTVLIDNNDTEYNYQGTHLLTNQHKPKPREVTKSRINKNISVFEEQFRCEIYEWRTKKLYSYIEKQGDIMTDNEILSHIFDYNTKEQPLDFKKFK